MKCPLVRMAQAAYIFEPLEGDPLRIFDRHSCLLRGLERCIQTRGVTPQRGEQVPVQSPEVALDRLVGLDLLNPIDGARLTQVELLRYVDPSLVDQAVKRIIA